MRTLLWIAITLPLMVGCGSVSTRYYSFPDIKTQSIEPVGKIKGVIVVGPIGLRESIDRPQLVVRRSDTQLEVRERDVWASSLQQETQILLIDSLKQLLQNEKIVPFPWTGQEGAHYRLTPDIADMTAQPGEEAVLTLAWSIYNERSGKQHKLPTTSYRAPVKADANLDEMVKIYRSLHLRAARDVAQRLTGTKGI
jgi:uncharacterized lipoprotein YmbA